MEKYIGRLAKCCGEKLEVVGYSSFNGGPMLIVDASQNGGWTELEPIDVVFKECEYYWHVDISDLID